MPTNISVPMAEALIAATIAPLQYGRAGFVDPVNKLGHHSSNTVQALEKRGFLKVEGKGMRRIATITGQGRKVAKEILHV